MTANLDTEDRQARMERIYKAFQEYVAAYEREAFFREYRDETFILDMLYGIGIAIDKEAYSCGDGFDRFKAHLRDIIK